MKVAFRWSSGIFRVSAAGVLADVATGYIVNVRDLGRARELSAQLQHALNSRVLIEQAKGFISATLAVDVDTALELLGSYSRSNGINIHEVAARVIDATLQVHAGRLRRADDRDLTP